MGRKYLSAGNRRALADCKRVAILATAEAERRGEGGAEIRTTEHARFFPGSDDAPLAQQQRMRNRVDDFLDVMRDEKQRRRIFPRDLPRREPLHEAEEMLARDGIETGARFVEDEHGGLCHERAGDEDALAFALREDAPVASGEVGALGGAHDLRGFGAVGAGDAAPVVEHGVFSADDDEAGGVPVGDLLPDGGTDEADALAQFAPVGIAVGLAEQLDLAGAGREVAGERAEERSLAGAVRAEDDPVLAALHAPVEPVEDERAVAMDDEAADVEDGVGLA